MEMSPTEQLIEEAIRPLRDQINELRTTQVKTVPYQACPICGGSGRLFNGGTTSAIDRQCDGCGGAKMIPMHIIT